MENSVKYVANPKLDFLFGMYGGVPIPTKQDKFVYADLVQINDDGIEEVLKNFYTKKPNSKSVEEFPNHLREIATDIFRMEKD